MLYQTELKPLFFVVPYLSLLFFCARGDFLFPLAYFGRSPRCEWDSNPRCFHITVFKTAAFDLSAIIPAPYLWALLLFRAPLLYYWVLCLVVVFFFFRYTFTVSVLRVSYSLRWLSPAFSRAIFPFRSILLPLSLLIYLLLLLINLNLMVNTIFIIAPLIDRISFLDSSLALI